MGSIELIIGCMFSGKSEELVRRLRRAKIAKQATLAFKHASDTRYDETAIGCHSGDLYEAIPASCPHEIADMVLSSGVDVVGIDEVQFFDSSIVEVCERLANKGVRVLVAGLHADAEAKPFGPVPELVAKADKIDMLYAICTQCGKDAVRSLYIGHTKEGQVEVGAKQYQAVCRNCFDMVNDTNLQ